MAQSTTHISNRRLRTPRAAAIAGIIFAVLMIVSLTMLQIYVPAGSTDTSEWLEENVVRINFALSLLPFAGIAFIWFLGVVRDRIGLLEDQFFSTLFFGSGLLYLAMTFATAAIAGGILARTDQCFCAGSIDIRKDSSKVHIVRDREFTG